MYHIKDEKNVGGLSIKTALSLQPSTLTKRAWDSVMITAIHDLFYYCVISKTA